MFSENKIFFFLKLNLAVLYSYIAVLCGGNDKLFNAFMFLLCADYVTGIIKGFITKKLSSYRGFRGILKKLTIIIAVATASQLEGLIGFENIRETFITFYIINEFISLKENISEIGENTKIFEKYMRGPK